MRSLKDLPILDGADVARLAPPLDLVDALQAAHREPGPASGRVTLCPPGHSERFLVLPAWAPGDLLTTKLTTVFAANPSTNGLPAVQAVVVLFDGADGSPLALLDGTELTYRKTAADSALGSRFCSRPDAAVLLVVGAGGLVPHLIAAHRAVRPSIEQVLVWNRTPRRADALVSAGIVDRRVDDLHEALEAADIVCTATMARDPLVSGRLLRPGTHVDAVGAYLPDHREIDDDVVRRADHDHAVFVDDRRAPLTESGDLVIPIARGVVAEDVVRADLFQLCQGDHPGRTTPEQVTLFCNGGGGHLDLMVARHIWRAHGRLPAARPDH